MQFFYSTAFTQSRNQAYGRYSREKYGSENSFSINFPGEKKKKKKKPMYSFTKNKLFHRYFSMTLVLFLRTPLI